MMSEFVHQELMQPGGCFLLAAVNAWSSAVAADFFLTPMDWLYNHTNHCAFLVAKQNNQHLLLPMVQAL